MAHPDTINAVMQAYGWRHSLPSRVVSGMTLYRLFGIGNAELWAGEADIPDWSAYQWIWAILAENNSFDRSDLRLMPKERFENEYLPSSPDIAEQLCKAGGMYGVTL